MDGLDFEGTELVKIEEFFKCTLENAHMICKNVFNVDDWQLMTEGS